MSSDVIMFPPGTPVPPDFDLLTDLILPSSHDLKLPPRSSSDVWIEHAISGRRALLLGQKLRDEASENAHAHGDDHDHGHEDEKAHGKQGEEGGGEEPAPPERKSRAARLDASEKESRELYQKLYAMWVNGCAPNPFPTNLLDRAYLSTSWPKQGDREFRWSDSPGQNRRGVHLGEDTVNWIAWLHLERKAINCVGWENNAIVLAADATGDVEPALSFVDASERGMVKQEAVIVGLRIQPAEGHGSGGHLEDEEDEEKEKDPKYPTRRLRKVFKQIVAGEKLIHKGKRGASFEETLPELPVDYQVWLPNLQKMIWVSQKVLRRQFGRGYGLVARSPGAAKR